MTKIQKKQVVEALKKRDGDGGRIQKPASTIEKTKAKAKETLEGSKKSSSAGTHTKAAKSGLKETAVRSLQLNVSKL